MEDLPVENFAAVRLRHSGHPISNGSPPQRHIILENAPRHFQPGRASSAALMAPYQVPSASATGSKSHTARRTSGVHAGFLLKSRGTAT
jgi:hypothetical protein